MSFNISDFANVIIPLILNGRTDYYVKGGRVYDIYFKDTTNSIDWDLVGTREFLLYIESKCEEWAKIFNKKLLKRNAAFEDRNMIQYGFDEYEEEKGDPFIFDIIIDDTIIDDTKYTTINGINYMKMENFVEDLITTLDDRATKLKKYFNVLGKNGDSYKEVEKYNKDHKTNFNLDKLKNFDQQTIDHFNQYISKNIKEERVKKIIQDNIINKISNININKHENGEEEDLQDILDKQDPTDEETEEMGKFLFLYEDWNSDIKANFTLQRTGKIEKSIAFKKYIKTNKRTNNVININWNNLTDVYKIYLLNECTTKGSKEIKLFKVNETCKAILNCRTKNLRRTTKTCIKNPELIEEVNLLLD